MKRAVWIGGASAAASLAFGTSPAVVGQTMRDVTFASLGPSAASWPFMIAAELKLYKRYGLNPENITISSTAAGAQLLIAKGVDLVDLSVTQLIEAVQGGAEIKMYSNTITTPPYALVAQKQYKKCSDLKGKMIVVGGVNDATRIFAERIMQAAGIMPDEYEETYAGATTERYAALRSGSVGAAILFPPWDFRATDDGFNIVGTVPAAMPPFPYDGLTARTEFARAHPDIMLDVMKVYLRALRWLYDPANKAKAVDILYSQTKTSSDDAARTYDELITKYKSFSPDSRLSTKTVSVVIDMLGQLKVLKPPLPAASPFFDNRFIDQATVQIAREGRS